MKFGTQDKKEEKVVEAKTGKASSPDSAGRSVAAKEGKTTPKMAQTNDLSWVIISPRITEKAAYLTGANGYTFNISPLANKIQVKQAIKNIYKVDPVSINIVNKKSREAVVRGRKVHKSGAKKAIVYLKKGDKIEFV